MSEHRMLIAVGAEVRAEAAARRIPMTKLSATIGTDRRTLYRYLDGDRDMPLQVFLALAGALRMRPDELMSRAEQRAGRDSQDGGDSQ